jgi:hypothetical protein
MTLGLMAKTFMPNLKDFWSSCIVNFQWLYWDNNTHVYGVCVHHLPACCHKQTVSLKHNLMTFHDDTNSMLCRTLCREKVSSNFGCQVVITIKLTFVCRGLGLLKIISLSRQRCRQLLHGLVPLLPDRRVARSSLYRMAIHMAIPFLL